METGHFSSILNKKTNYSAKECYKTAMTVVTYLLLVLKNIDDYENS